MPIVNSDDNREYNLLVYPDTHITIQIFHATPSPFYYVAIVDGETVEDYADTEGEAYRKAFEGIDWLIKGREESEVQDDS